MVERNSDGSARRLAGVWVEIDGQRRAEREFRLSEARLETAVWGAGMGLWELDFRSGETRWYSDWCERLDLRPGD